MIKYWKKYRYATKLSAIGNNYISNVNHLTKLRDLNISYNYKIYNKWISNLTNLEILDACCCPKNIKRKFYDKIKKKINASGTCRIDDGGILYLTDLEILIVQNNSRITDDEILYLTDLEILNAGDNSKITNINHMT
jgi:hypothetical protein